MKLYVFDDREADAWAPFALSRPVSELRFGALLLRERIERFAGRPADGLLTRPWLQAYAEAGAPSVTDLSAVPRDEDRLLLCSRFVPADDVRFEAPGGPAVLRATAEDGDPGEPAGCWLPAGTPTPAAGWTSRPGPLPEAGETDVQGRLLPAVWDLIRDGTDRTARDVELLAPDAARVEAGDLPDGVTAEGDRALHLGPGARLEPGVHLDLRSGPVWLGPGVEVRSGCRLAGPVWAGRECRLLGGPIGPLAAGPVSHLRGEVSEVTTLGWVNKAHAGHLGHAYLGRWVNLGAATNNSDLKNNYGPVRLGGPEGERETGMLKLGCLLGDHVKTAIGTLLPTGCAAGAGANMFGAVRPPKWVPPFAWGTGPGADVYRRADFLDTAETVMARRGEELGDGGRAWLGAVWDRARERRPAPDAAAGP